MCSGVFVRRLVPSPIRGTSVSASINAGSAFSCAISTSFSGSRFVLRWACLRSTNQLFYAAARSDSPMLAAAMRTAFCSRISL
jgi:hypothetical protein